nr:MAG TPA: hypothetical protein [Caudoviricetes sp.]
MTQTTIIYFLLHIAGVVFNILCFLSFLKLCVIYKNIKASSEFAYYNKTTDNHIVFLSIFPFLYGIFLSIWCGCMVIGLIIKYLWQRLCLSSDNSTEQSAEKHIKGFSILSDDSND